MKGQMSIDRQGTKETSVQAQTMKNQQAGCKKYFPPVLHDVPHLRYDSASRRTWLREVFAEQSRSPCGAHPCINSLRMHRCAATLRYQLLSLIAPCLIVFSLIHSFALHTYCVHSHCIGCLLAFTWHSHTCRLLASGTDSSGEDLWRALA